MKSVKVKEYTRSPNYGKFQGFTPTGKEEAVSFLNIELTYDGKEYRAGELLAQTVRNQIHAELVDSKMTAQSRKIKRLEEENKLMKDLLSKINSRLKKLEGENKIL